MQYLFWFRFVLNNTVVSAHLRPPRRERMLVLIFCSTNIWIQTLKHQQNVKLTACFVHCCCYITETKTIHHLYRFNFSAGRSLFFLFHGRWQTAYKCFTHTWGHPLSTPAVFLIVSHIQTCSAEVWLHTLSFCSRGKKRSGVYFLESCFSAFYPEPKLVGKYASPSPFDSNCCKHSL